MRLTSECENHAPTVGSWEGNYNKDEYSFLHVPEAAPLMIIMIIGS